MSQPPSTSASTNVRSQSGLARFDLQESHFNRARVSLRQAIARYSQHVRSPKRRPVDVELQAALKANLDQLSNTLDKLDHNVIRIAVFGLVSRGKSAVLNALLGQKVLQTGPLHGVTQWPRSVYWSAASATGKVQVELIDTPGLDEVHGQVRERMAREVVQQADLILFVVAGDITRTEYQALCELQAAKKPLIVVFNKIDLYPDEDRQTIYQKLQRLSATDRNRVAQPVLSSNEIVMVAAEPAPLQVRVELPNGQVSYEWEAPPPQVDELKYKLLDLLNQEGRSLLALNALRQTRNLEAAIAHKTLELHNNEAEELIWRFTKYKAMAVALNPIALLDLIGGAGTDLVMIRSLAKLYGLPMTRYEASKLWKTILLSSGSLLLSQLGSGLLLSLGKSAAAAATVLESPAGFAAYTATMAAQAGAAGYGAYTVGRAAQVYLEQGCTWGPQGPDTIIQDILNQVEPNSILFRLCQELDQ